MALSPTAQEVLNAAMPALNNLHACGFNHQRYDCRALADALRAVADQVVPEPPAHWRGEWLSELRLGKWTAIHEARTSLLALADELESQSTN